MKLSTQMRSKASRASSAGSNVADFGGLQEISTRLSEMLSVRPLLDDLLKAVMELEHADFGLLSIHGKEAEGSPELIASGGLPEAFLAAVKGAPEGEGPWAACLARKERVVVTDTKTDPLFARSMEAARKAGFCAVHCTPLITRSGAVLGVLSTLFRKEHTPAKRTQRLTDLYARQAADYLEIARLYQQAQQEVAGRRAVKAAGGDVTFSQVLEKLPAAAYLCDAEGLITFYNREAVRMWGRAPRLKDAADRYCGSFKIFSAHDGKPLAHADCWMALALRTGRDYLGQEILIEREDGSRITAIAHASPLHSESGALLGAITILIDISDRKTIEQRNAKLLAEVVKRSDQLLVLARASQALNSELDVPTIMRKLVELGLEMTGVEGGCAGLMEQGRMMFREYNRKGELLPLDLVFRKEDKWGIPSWVMRHKAPYFSNDATNDVFLRPDLKDAFGIRNFINIPIFNREGALIACFELHNKPEGFSEQTMVALQGLAAVASTALENAKLIAKAREDDQRKDEFLAILAHELRNPLAPIRTALHIMQSPQSTKEIRLSARDMMERQVEHMVRLVDDLLDVARITRGKIELKKEPVLLSDIIASAVETSRPILEDLRHSLSVTLPPHPVTIEADMVRLSQVFANLLHNAAKYTHAGGAITLSALMQSDSLKVEVSDTGIGMSPETLSRIFDMFSQGNTSLERAQGGLGIGLTLVRTLVELHGGTVTASSDGPNKGSRFTVYLPAKAEEEAKEEEAPGEEAEASEGESPRKAAQLRVLVVDDNEASAQTLAWAMELLGHDVRLAHNGPDAIAIGKEFIPHVVLLDIGLPGMNGYQVCQEMKQDPKLEGTIFVAQTGWGQEQYRKLSKDAGFTHHLVKPVSLDTLEELLASITPV